MFFFLLPAFCLPSLFFEMMRDCVAIVCVGIFLTMNSFSFPEHSSPKALLVPRLIVFRKNTPYYIPRFLLSFTALPLDYSFNTPYNSQQTLVSRGNIVEVDLAYQNGFTTARRNSILLSSTPDFERDQGMACTWHSD